jgi:hypothetical protein
VHRRSCIARRPAVLQLLPKYSFDQEVRLSL